MRSLTSPIFQESAFPLRSPLWRSPTRYTRTPKHLIVPAQGIYVHHKSPHSDHEDAVDQSHLSHSGFNYEPNVDLSSLKRTLEAHRLANRAGLIRKRDEYGKWEPIIVPSSLRSEPTQIAQEQKHDPTHHLKITRSTDAYEDSHREYVGKSRPLLKAWRLDTATPRRWRYPWLTHISRLPAIVNHQSAIDRLADEIRAFDEYLAPSVEEQAAASLSIADIQQAVLDACPGVDLHLIGSRSTSLARPLSDIDFNVDKATTWNIEVAKHKRKTPDFLLRLYRKLDRSHRKRSSAIASKIQVTTYLRKAKIPIIRGVHLPSGLEFEIQNTQSVYDSTESVRYFMNEFPTLQSLYGVIKHMLTIRGLCSGPIGGITSYPLLNMIIATLKLTQHKNDRLDIGRQFLSFLDMYSTIDFHNTAISIQPPRLIFDDSLHQDLSDAEVSPKTTIESNVRSLSTEEADPDTLVGSPQIWSRKQKDHPYMMRLQDPADCENNLGRSANMIKYVQATILSASHMVKAAMNDWDERVVDELADRNALPPLLDFCLGADYREFESSRKDLRLSYMRAMRKQVRGEQMRV